MSGDFLSVDDPSRSTIFQRLAGDWHPLVEKPVPEDELHDVMQKSALPVLSFYLMLIFAGAIATLGLLANSAPTIIGAMIIAPLMSPIISLAFGLVVVDWQLINRSIFMVVTGVLLVVVLALVTTELIGLQIAGSEILSRTNPTLLDLGVAMAAGGAAAFAFTRKSIMNAIAGVAIAVALVPPLAVCGIGLSLGSHASADVGYASAEIGAYSGGTNIAEGAALLFATNLAGIVITAGTIFVAHGYGQTLKAVLGLTIACIASIGLLHPLGVSLYKLHVKSVAMNTVIAARKAMPRLYDDDARIEGVRVQFKGHTVHLNIDVLGSEAGVQNMQEKIDVFQNVLSARLRRPVVVEVDLIPVPIRHFVSNGAVQLKQTPVPNSEVRKELGHVDNVQQPVK